MFVGSMFSSKSSRLLAALDRCRYQNKKVIAFKPQMDERYSQSDIVTHGGLSWPAINVSNGEQIVKLAIDADVVAVDEAFMIDGCADALVRLFKSGKTILVSSIQLSASGIPFNEVKEMMPWATRIDVCPAVCPITHRDAFYTVRKISGLSEIAVGGDESYSPACFEHTPFMRNDD